MGPFKKYIRPIYPPSLFHFLYMENTTFIGGVSLSVDPPPRVFPGKF